MIIKSKILDIKRRQHDVLRRAAFWDSNLIWRSVYKLILKHRFPPFDVANRYVWMKEREIIRLMNKKE